MMAAGPVTPPMSISVIIPSWSNSRATAVIQNLRKNDTQQAAQRYRPVGTNRLLERWGPVEAMARGAKDLTTDILVFCHDDIEVYEDWAMAITTIFDYVPGCGLVGFHGAKGLGSEDIYRTRYQLSQLARYNPMSNMVDAEQHGKYVTIPVEVATIDGFFMAVRRETYEAVGGWEACLRDKIVFHMYDSWMAMAAREHGYRTFMAPVNCRHQGGATEVGMTAEYEKWAIENGFKDGTDVHTQGHLAFYERFRGQLPIRIN
jgi:GT2 family glycosyltransferase